MVVLSTIRNWWGRLGVLTKTQWLITTPAIVLVLAHLLIPWISVDWVALTLFAIAVAPWLVPIIKSVELPGGLKVELEDLEKLENRARNAGLISEKDTQEAETAPSYMDVADSDPNLALAGLRIEIERQLNRIAEPFRRRRRIYGVRRMMELLRTEEVLTKQQIAILSDLIGLLNSAVHGADVDPASAAWALAVGPKLVRSLQEIEPELAENP